MFNRSGRTRPTASGVGSFQNNATAPTSSAPSDPAHSRVQAQYKPDFLAPKPSLAAQPKAAIEERSITTSYQRARAELANPELFGGPMTEKQTRELNWQKREDPIGYRDQLLQNQRMYGSPTQPTSSAPPSRRTNFNGPGRRFGA